MSNYQYPLPSPHTGYSGSNNIARHTLANNNNTLTNSNHPSTSFLPSMEEEECNLLPFKLFESVDGHNQQQQQQQQQQHLSFDQPLSWCMVEFKAGRAEIYYSTIPIQQDDWVIVEADRGRDLGKVVAKDLPLDQVHLLLAATNNSANSTPTTATTVLTAGADSLNNNSNNNNMLLLDHPPSPSASLSSTSSSSSSSSLPLPKQICRLATTSEITLLVTKRHDEQKALLICQTKSKQKNLLMDIVDAEYQW
jgi:cell fate regulator YaaT (PSP1 superfamily)